jgi:CRISPR system Cascade subunit CasA
MIKKEFNLLHETWILVIKPDGETEEVSLLELFKRAPEFTGLAGEMPTQDVAILRLLLAILHAVFERYAPDGSSKTLDTPGEALLRWKELWDRGSFPIEIIKKYLLCFEERFYLFHPEYPFYQVAKLDKSTNYTAAKLNGTLSESSNKIRLFKNRSGDSKEFLRYPEAARWLLYVNAYDDTSAKPKVKGLPSPGTGWLGKLGLIAAYGGNLFESLLLNLVFLKDGENELWGGEKPVWELEYVKARERTEISIPDNQSELLTLQSRRLLLKRQDDLIVGYALLGGDFFQKENTFSEQMTVWRNSARKKTEQAEYLPKRHDPEKQIWRDFSALVVQNQGKRRPGIVNWISRLKSENIILFTHFRFLTASVKYGDKDFFIDDVFSDSISINAELLTELGSDWVSRIVAEIETTEQLVAQVGFLAKSLTIASGGRDDGHRNAAKEQAYFRLDVPFRKWLEEIDPINDEMREASDIWWKEEQRIIRRLGKELVDKFGLTAFIGRTVSEMNGKKVRRHTAPEAYNKFLYRTSNRETLKGGYKSGK